MYKVSYLSTVEAIEYLTANGYTADDFDLFDNVDGCLQSIDKDILCDWCNEVIPANTVFLSCIDYWCISLQHNGCCFDFTESDIFNTESLRNLSDFDLRGKLSKLVRLINE